MGSSSLPNRTSTRACGTPSTTQTSLFVVLLTHMARPVRQRGSSPSAVSPAAGFGLTLLSSSEVGLRVMATSRSKVRWSTSPVTGMPRLVWKLFTAVTVDGP